MASVKFGALVVGLKGKIGGTVFQSGPSGYVAKNIDAIADSAKLTKADAGRIFKPTKIIAIVSGLWRNLDQANRDAWNAQAVNWPAQNRFGETYTPSGYQVFMTLNTQTYGFTGIVIETPPIPESSPPLVDATFDVPDSAIMNMSITGVVPPGYQLRVEASQPMGASKNAKVSLFKIIAQIPAGVIYPQDLADGYKEVYGLWPQFCTIWFRIALINMSTGQKGLYQNYKYLVSF